MYFFSFLVDLYLQLPILVAAKSVFSSSGREDRLFKFLLKEIVKSPVKMCNNKTNPERNICFKALMELKSPHSKKTDSSMTGKSYCIMLVCHWKEIAENSYQRLCDV